MVKLMNKCPKSTNSIGNILILFTVMIGFYILYRYIKSLESDLKLIKNEIIDIKRNSVNNCVDDTIKNSDINALNDINNSEKQESCENIVYINDDNDDICQNDDESVKSEEIDMILKNINSEDDDDIIIDEDDQEYIKTNSFRSTKEELFYYGCKTLCSEPNFERQLIYKTSKVSPEKRIALASRIAAVMIFCNKGVIDLGKIKSYAVNDVNVL